MSKQPKVPFKDLHKPTDAEVRAAIKPTPFKRCPSCGNSIISSAKYCNECARLVELGMRDAVPQFVQANPSVDTQPKQSYCGYDHSGYTDTSRPKTTKQPY
jgi:hypothetical protein